MKRIIGFLSVGLLLTVFSCQNERVDVMEQEGLSEKSARITLTETGLEAIATAMEYEGEFYGNAERLLSGWWKNGKSWKWTNKLNYQINHCPDVSIVEGESDGYPKVITLNYGEGTVLKNNKVLSGIIVIEISAPKTSASFSRMVSYQNFGIDSVQIAGTSLIKVDRANETLRNHSSNLTFTLSDGAVVTRASERAWTWVEGMETTDDQSDDVIHIVGKVTATSGTDSYTKEIMEPLVRLGDCKYIVKGIVKLTLNSELVSLLNYGDGECDEVATMTTADGEIVEVNLGKCKMNGNQMQNQNRNQQNKQNQNKDNKQNSNQQNKQNQNNNKNKNNRGNGKG